MTMDQTDVFVDLLADCGQNLSANQRILASQLCALAAYGSTGADEIPGLQVKLNDAQAFSDWVKEQVERVK